MNKQQIIFEAEQIKLNIKTLKEIAPAYPVLAKGWDGNVFSVTTIVFFTHEGSIYARHHVETGYLHFGITKEKLEELTLKRIRQAADMCILHALPVEFDDKITLT